MRKRETPLLGAGKVKPLEVALLQNRRMAGVAVRTCLKEG